ncbi:Golgin subfamily A member 7/ERF4 family-domain-containing protein [Colletotrichum navitas]|uniref:Ras modification protein ERF4 n=1 Tax=Colletotrichum navitas TaxID=681940 RepID=A0AAD8Q9Z3_9PEZI|nr:Golgin subfamily A member 7/ERF4 family-domain-containing protein [Colletotrichum navitas]KAK1598741.1 Golgin subfamily A member 7/ERF4 family-domain-containing protein [Colletotrichum navitas]
MEQGTESQTRGPSKDLERGPDVLPRYSNASAGDAMGIGSAISSSNSSIMGEELPPDMGEEWGPQHPCFPHLNPHVPVDSPEYRNTRIIRVRRDWLIEGDLAPTFSNLYPEILDPAGLSEQEFRRIIDKLNGELIPVFSPYSWRNILDGLLGLMTGWLWDDLGFTGVKARLDRLERWIDQWNTEMEKTFGNEDGSMAPRIISLRKTGYMTVSLPSLCSAQGADPDCSWTSKSRTLKSLQPLARLGARDPKACQWSRRPLLWHNI